MGKDILMLGDVEIEKNKYYPHKILIFKKDVDTEKVLVSNKIYCGQKRNFKYFIDYLYNDNKVRLLQIMLLRICKKL